MGKRYKPRKGAVRFADISPRLRSSLSRGEQPTITAVEWMAIDMALLVRSTLPQVGLAEQAERIARVAAAAKDRGVMERTRTIVEALAAELPKGRARSEIMERLSSHPMDSVRNWACWLTQLERPLKPAQRLDATRRFAADPHMAVREFAWMTMRPHLAEDLPLSLKLLGKWATDNDANIRRCAIEVLRPRGVWCAHIAALKSNPAPAEPLLELVKADESLYVRKSAGNWLNDAAKSRPEWVRKIAKRWLRGDPHPHTRWIVKHGLRSLD